MQVIMLTGLKGHGKSTVAKHLVKEHGFIELSFADTIKDVLAIIFSWDRDMLAGTTVLNKRVREYVDFYWAKRLNIKDFSPRKALTLIGTDILRKRLSDNLWVCTLEIKLEELRIQNPDAKIVVSDAREVIELQMLKNYYHATSLLIQRLDMPYWYEEAKAYNKASKIVKPFLHLNHTLRKCLKVPSLFDAHVTERNHVGYDFNYTIHNDTDVERLHAAIEEVLEKVKTKPLNEQENTLTHSGINDVTISNIKTVAK